MFESRDLDGALAAVRDESAPDALVLHTERDFETLDPAVAEELGLLVESLDPVSYPPEWLPADAPDQLREYAGSEFTIGLPGDGGVAWTRQTDPPVVFVKPRLRTSPDPFVRFLIAEALVEVGLDLPESFLAFFGARYADLDAAVPLEPAGVYQLAAALYTAYCGLHTREVFADWETDHPDLFDAWVDAGERLEPRLGDLSTEVARGQTEFATAAELACSAVKHAADDRLEIPSPFAALDTAAYARTGPEYAVEWARKTFEKLS
ncbi:DUF7089 family protein [Halorientalis halophila]|uniref:DUF7089 family protein n=1 Tax=Halorientalis halophila TaxID=3108499 RepID=UPI003008A2BB